MKTQRRARAIAMSDDERDAFLATERTVRVATNGTHGPHATPLYFVWDGAAMWFSSLTRAQRWKDLEADPRMGAVVDAGEFYGELRGVEIRGRVEPVGEIPRTGEPNPELEAVEQAFADKYTEGSFGHDGRHAWLKLVPEKISSWDFRKIHSQR
jgi:hypothetical protein